jgi:hypothetical protein
VKESRRELWRGAVELFPVRSGQRRSPVGYQSLVISHWWKSQQLLGLGKPGRVVRVRSLTICFAFLATRSRFGRAGLLGLGVWSQVRLDASDKDFLPVR